MAIILNMIYQALVINFMFFNNLQIICDYFINIYLFKKYSKLIDFCQIIILMKNYLILIITRYYLDFNHLKVDLFLNFFEINLFCQKIFCFFVEIFLILVFVYSIFNYDHFDSKSISNVLY